MPSKKKKKKLKAAAKPAAAALTLEMAESAGIRLIQARPGDTLTVLVDVENVSVFYTVAYDARTLMFALVDRQESVALTAGTHRLAWSFSHVQKGWSHKVSVRINQGAFQVLDSKSEAKKDSPHTVDFVVVEVR